MISVSNTDGPAFNTRSQTHQCLVLDTPTVSPSVSPDITPTPDPTPKYLTAEQVGSSSSNAKTDPFCKHISKRLSNGKAPKT